ncbi:MAG: response regulator [Bacteroidia bacterium]|nr:response regulator [Bacteroidia bacterium]
MSEITKILIVDDKIENLIALERLMVDFNVEPIRALSGNQALQLTLYHNFALALVDVQMPDMDGFETVTLMRSNEATRHLPVIFVSAIYREDFHVVKGLESGAVDFITKPINPEILKGKIRVFLDLYYQKHQLESEIKERGKIQKSLEQSNFLLNTLLQSIPDIVFYKSLSGSYIGCNKTFESYFGLIEKQIIGKSDQDLFPRELATDLQKLENQLKTSLVTVEKELWVSMTDGKKVLLDYRVNPIFNQAGELTGMIGIARDTTERFNDKQALQQAKDEADAANLAKSMFLANMSHEIRTPMNGIIGMTDILMETELSPEQIEFLQIIRLSGDNLLLIINDILDLSKIEAGKITLEKINFNLAEKIDETVKLLSLQAMKKGLDLKCKINPEVPAILNGDPLRIKQILINLINNAVKFTCDGGVSCEIELFEESAAKVKLIFRVIDTGIGITEDGKAMLFRSFSQTDAAITRKFGGTGLGLTISKRLVELMHGEIGVDSEEGKGSTFWFTAEFGRSECMPDISEPVMLEPATEFRKLYILLAEDNPVNQRVATYNLTRLGHKVDIAENGQEAIALGVANQYDILLMDIQMPVMDGIEATYAIRQWEKSSRQSGYLPIIAMTADAVKGNMENFLAEGMNGFISKPFKIEDLKTILKLAR